MFGNKESSFGRWLRVGLCGLVCGFAGSAGAAVTIQVDVSRTSSPVRDLLGVNKPPTYSSRTPGVSYDASSLYRAFGISQARLHDSGVDLCTVYKAATRTNAGVTPPVAVSSCTLTPSGGVPHFVWTPSSSADADLNNPDNYDFSPADEAVRTALAAGTRIYLGLAQNYNGPNDTNDPVAWAKVATNIYRHVIGQFKPTAGIAVDPAFVEIHNEPDGGFWRGDTATFYTLYRENTQRVRDAAAAAGKSVKIGGAGFTRDILSTSARAGNPANGFIAAVGASSLDFYSAHLYDRCANASVSASAGFLRTLRSRVDSTGGAGKPLHISEWNIGLGSDCGEAFFASSRNQSFAGSVLTIMQDPSLAIEAAHYYAGVTVMSLFDFNSVANAVRINPAAWAFWAHAKLAGGTMVETQVCASQASCQAGYASETATLQALAGRRGSGYVLVVSNDGAAAADYGVQLSGLASTTVDVTISTPPAGTRDVAVEGSPLAPNATALNTALSAVSADVRRGLAVTQGALSLNASIPAYSVQVIEVAPAGAVTQAQADCLFNWAERNYDRLFNPPAVTASSTPYTYRYYSGTRNYLAVSATDSHIWMLGPDTRNQLSDVGAASGYLTAAGCSR